LRAFDYADIMPISSLISFCGEKRIAMEIARLSGSEIEESIKCLQALQGPRAGGASMVILGQTTRRRIDIRLL